MKKKLNTLNNQDRCKAHRIHTCKVKARHRKMFNLKSNGRGLKNFKLNLKPQCYSGSTRVDLKPLRNTECPCPKLKQKQIQQN